MILILANKWDLTVDLVVLELQRRGIHFVRLNTEDLPEYSAVARFPEGLIQLRKKEFQSLCLTLAQFGIADLVMSMMTFLQSNDLHQPPGSL
jgi:hypothetical protein